MVPQDVQSSKHDQGLRRSHRGSISGSQYAPGGLIQAPDSNPWASEAGDRWPTITQQSQQHSTGSPRETIGSTQEANLRPSLRQRATQIRQRKADSSPGKPTRSREDRFGRDTPNVRNYEPGGSWEADSEMSHSSESHSEDADGFSDSGVHSDLAHDKLVYQIQRLQKRLASWQHNNTNPETGEDRSAPAQPWKVLHEVQCPNTEHLASYLDEPELAKDRDLGHLHWQGSKRVANVKTWTRKQKHPFIVYRQYHCVHERKEISEPSEKIQILSDELHDVLLLWLEASPGLALYDDEAVYVDRELEAPYLCFYHFRHEARQLLSESGNSSGNSAQDALHLLNYLEMSTAAITREAEEVFASGKVTAKLMPYLFKPGALVCFQESEDFVVCEQASLLIVSSEDRDLQQRSYELSTVRITFDGKFRRLRPFTHRIDFRAARDESLNIADLSVQPLSSIPSERRTELKRRGETFIRCQNQLYVTYPGKEGHHDFVDTRFMVDVEAYHMLHDKEASEALDRGNPISESSIDSLKGTEDFLLQLPPTIEGFNMTEKKWIHLQVSGIKEVEWSPQTFHSVEIEPKSKELIEALVRNKIEREEGIDFVRGKGTGLVVLLHGGPGTGKTLTAEGVAEIAKKPLYRVTGGDVGTDPRAVERYLESVFYLGRRWNCVVLLDEADVFLEQRSFANLERNALVSVFLRVIEYYDGILILTSNRVGTFDEAFKSRIQLALHFDNLDANRRAKIWAKFIDRLAELNEDVDFDDVRAHLDALAQPAMNGRQIRNAVTTARQLARFRKKKLNYTHLKQAIGVSQKFENYVKDVKGGQDDDEIAEQDMLRVRGK